MQGRGGYAVRGRGNAGECKKERVSAFACIALRLCVNPLRLKLEKFYALITHQYHPVVGEESVFRGMRQCYFSFFGCIQINQLQ
jgi:hypothetical protein